MPADNIKDIRGINYLGITLIPENIAVAVIGGGKAALIKAKSFAESGADVEVISKDFLEEFAEIKPDNIKLIKGEYKTRFILDKHIVVIAVNGDIEKKIIDDCENFKKIYIVCSNFNKGNAIRPFQGSTENVFFTVNTKGNPRGAVFIAKKIKELLQEYDDFLSYVYGVRESIKAKKDKDKIMQYLNSEEFYDLYKSGFSEKVLKLFLEEENDKGCNQKE
jgi:precorrin-2 dehydrogenase/sirohydrochlorin ferrochelatase